MCWRVRSRDRRPDRINERLVTVAAVFNYHAEKQKAAPRAEAEACMLAANNGKFESRVPPPPLPTEQHHMYVPTTNHMFIGSYHHDSFCHDE